MNTNTQKNQGSMFSRMFKPSAKLNTVPVSSPDEIRELLQNIKDARKEWVDANVNFEFAESEELVDYYSYIIKAFEVKYEYLIKQAKQMGIKAEILEDKNIALSKNTYNA